MRAPFFSGAVPLTASRPPLRAALLPALIVVWATCFNSILAAVNGNVVSLTPAPVVVSEVLCVGFAQAVALRHFRRRMVPWYALLSLFAAFAVVRALAFQTFDVKYLRDVMIIPTFVVLGMCFDPRRLPRVYVTLQCVMLAFLALEALDVDAYSALFRVKEYYISTRGYTEDAFWNGSSDLYVSATRPGGSFLALVDLHRLSSIMLEPVSLGNYCMAVLAYLCASGREIERKTQLFLAITTAVAVVGCDGRLAIASVLPMVICCMLAPRAPRGFGLVYMPAVLALGFALVSIGRFEPGGDDFPSRIAHTVHLLRSYDVDEFLGVSEIFMSKAVDSGIAYLITTQSIFVVIAIWATVGLSSSEDRPDKKRIVHAVMIYVALNMMVSFALLTIKTSALLWFTYGSLQGRRSETPIRATRGLVPSFERDRSHAATARSPLLIRSQHG